MIKTILVTILFAMITTNTFANNSEVYCMSYQYGYGGGSNPSFYFVCGTEGTVLIKDKVGFFGGHEEELERETNQLATKMNLTQIKSDMNYSMKVYSNNVDADEYLIVNIKKGKKGYNLINLYNNDGFTRDFQDDFNNTKLNNYLIKRNFRLVLEFKTRNTYTKQVYIRD